MLETVDLSLKVEKEEYQQLLIKNQVALHALSIRSTCNNVP